MSTTELQNQLDHGLEQLQLPLPASDRQRLLAYVDLLQKWNKVYNLTAVREPAAMVSHHLLDSLVVLPHLAGVNCLLDVGTGPGLPGIPLAIVRPELKVCLLDSNHKKTTFLRQACMELGLAHAEILCERVEQWQPAEKFEAIVSRAFSELKEFVRLTAHLLAKNGKLYALKGVYPHEEIAQLPEQAKIEAVHPLQVPGLDAQRHLVVIKLEE